METWFVCSWEDLRKYPPSCDSEFPLVFMPTTASPIPTHGNSLQIWELGSQYWLIKNNGRSQTSTESSKEKKKGGTKIECQVEIFHPSRCQGRTVKGEVPSPHAAMACKSILLHITTIEMATWWQIIGGRNPWIRLSLNQNEKILNSSAFTWRYLDYLFCY